MNLVRAVEGMKRWSGIGLALLLLSACTTPIPTIAPSQTYSPPAVSAA